MNHKKKTLSYIIALTGALATAGVALAQSRDAYPQNNYSDTDDTIEDRDSDDYWENFKHDAGETWNDTQTAFRDGWLEAKLESAVLMNDKLSAFEISTDVEGRKAVLDGTVTSQSLKSLASRLAKNVKGIESVDNRLQVEKEINEKRTQNERSRSAAQYARDASITASIKAKLLTNSAVDGLDIDVDTKNSIVTLGGSANSTAEKALIGMIAQRQEDVSRVVNNIEVKS